MRARSLLIAGTLAAGAAACAQHGQGTSERRLPVAAPTMQTMAHPPTPAQAPVRRVDFATQIQPLLEARCRPCHFAGGKMYARLPFDRAETIVALREKLFTRIKDEKERQPIREFLALNPGSGASHPGGS